MTQNSSGSTNRARDVGRATHHAILCLRSATSQGLRVLARLPPLLLAPQPVSHAELGEEQPGSSGVGFELAAQLGHVHPKIV